MLIIRCILCIAIALFSPKIWEAMKGVSEHQFSQVLISDVQPSMSVPAQDVLLQPFSYWGQGSQFFVFMSQDQRYVLKIPRASKMRESLLDRIRKRKLDKPDVLESLSIAFDSLAAQTAVLYAHYGRSDPMPTAILIDRLHRRIQVDLNTVPFALQKKKGLMSQALMQSKNVDESRRILTSFLDLIATEKAFGWMSQDCQFWLNFGYEDGIAWRIDVGSYVSLQSNFSWRKAAKPVCHWLRKNDPSLYAWFENELSTRER